MFENLFKLGRFSRAEDGNNLSASLASYLTFFRPSSTSACPDSITSSASLRHDAASNSGSKSFVAHYYAIATDFYEYGWGDSFHFAPLSTDEPLQESFRRMEYYLALRLAPPHNAHIADLGCGIAGPARNIARFTSARVTGVTISDYQVRRAKALNAAYAESNKQNPRAGTVEVIEGDFMKLPFPDASLDAAYAIEAICHASDKRAVYAEALRVLKPGARFATYEWVMTPLYDPSNPEHVSIRYGIERGNGLPEIVPSSAVLADLAAAGFEILDSFDAVHGSEIPWYEPLQPRWTVRDFLKTRIGHLFTRVLTRVLEAFRLLPKGAAGVNEILMEGARCLVDGGESGIFTPNFFVLARKPETPHAAAAKSSAEAAVGAPVEGVVAAAAAASSEEGGASAAVGVAEKATNGGLGRSGEESNGKGVEVEVRKVGGAVAASAS